MGNKIIVALVCVLIASPVLAQTITTTEPVIVTGPVVGMEEGSAASYQPDHTLVVRIDNANNERFDMYGPALIYDKYGRIVTTPIPAGTRVRVFYTVASPERIVDHIEVEE